MANPSLPFPQLLRYQDHFPQLGENVFIAPGAIVIGQVILGSESSVWFGTVLRGDVMPITIGARTNIQDLSLGHTTSGKYALQVGDDVTVGHRAILHGCQIANHVLIGMGAIILDGCNIEEGAIVAAGAVVSPGTHVPSRTLFAGIPAKAKRAVTDAEYQNLKQSALHYVALAKQYQQTSK